MSIYSGQDSKLQIGKESTWGTYVIPTKQISFTSESLTYVPEYVEEDALVGAKTSRRMDNMGVKAQGDFTYIVKPDNVGLLLAATLGAEADSVVTPANAEITSVKTVADVSSSLDATYFLLDDPTTDYYVWIDVAAGGNDPGPIGTRTAIDIPITASATAAEVATAVQGAINAETDFSATVNANEVIITDANAGNTPDAVDVDTGFDITVIEKGHVIGSAAYDHVFTPIAGGGSNSLPSLSVTIDRQVDVHGYSGLKVNTLSLDATAKDYLRSTISLTGKTEENNKALEDLAYESRAPFIFRGGQVTIDTYTYEAEITSVAINYSNNLEDGQWTMGSGLYMIEPEVQKRMITITLESLYNPTIDAIRSSKFKGGVTASVVLYFVSSESVETDINYQLKIEMPYVQITSASPNVSGPDRITISLDGTALEGASEACTVTLTDNQAAAYL